MTKPKKMAKPQKTVVFKPELVLKEDAEGAEQAPASPPSELPLMPGTSPRRPGTIPAAIYEKMMKKAGRGTKAEIVMNDQPKSYEPGFTAGRHYAQVTIVKGRHICIGVNHPAWESECPRNADGNPILDASDQDGHCFYYTRNGRKFPGGVSSFACGEREERGERRRRNTKDEAA